MSPEDNPADEIQPTKEEWEAAMGTENATELSDEQDAVLLMAYRANSIGTPLVLDCRGVQEFGVQRTQRLIDELKLRKLIYAVRETDDSPAGYCLTAAGDAIAAPLYTAYHQVSRQTPPPPKATPAIEGKYGEVTTTGKQFHPGEPVFILRATDPIAPATVRAYGMQCELFQCDPEHAASVYAAAERIAEWQKSHPELVKKLPD